MDTKEYKELRPCPFCQSVPKVGGGMLVHPICECFGDVYIEWDKWQTRPLEDALQKRVEELENRLKQALHFDDDTADGYDWQVLESAFKYDDLRASISKAVEDVQKLDRHNVRIGDFMSIFQKHGLIGEQK